METEEMILYRKVIPERQAQYADFPRRMSGDLAAYLLDRGIRQLYIHQAEMYDRAVDGENLVITTSTASGKTLSFLLPVIEEILRDPLTRAIFLYPTKALAADQYRAMKPVIDFFGAERISAGVYDGDTPVQERSRIRRSANIILTNPDMLNGAFLPNHSRYGFDFLFSNLKFVVIDELHTCRGVFGSHVANLMRRLTRVCGYYGAKPQFLCSSATIANPVELGENICGVKFGLVDRDGSPAAERRYLFLQPPRIEESDRSFAGQVQAVTVAASLIPELAENGHSFLAFCKSRRTVEVLLREARDKLDAANFLGHSDADRVSGYRGGYTPAERRKIERDMVSGRLAGLVCTNALELGIDIGAVDTTVLVGYPGTRASFWQQTGRAGRSGRPSTGYLVLESLPLDQYIAVNPDWLFDTSSEHAIIDPRNLLIQLAHIRAAAAELPLTLADIALFPDLGEAIPVLMRAGELVSRGGKFVWDGNAFPAGDFSLRNMDEKRYKLMDRETHREITEMDETQAFRELHEGAIYMHDGEQYQILKLDCESRTATAIPFNGNYYTMPGGTTEVRILHTQEQCAFGRTELFWGDVNVDETVWMYKKLQFHNHQNLGYETLKDPLEKDYDTESCWICIPDEVTELYRNLLQPDGQGHLVRNNHFDGLSHALHTAAQMVTMTEREDLGVSVSSGVFDVPEESQGKVMLYLYDKFQGGLGYAEKAYEKMDRIVSQAIDLVAGCPCKDGCAACVGDYKLDKNLVLWGLRSLREVTAKPECMKRITYPGRKAEEKAFRYAELEEKWQDFCAYLTGQGENYGAFLSGIRQVRADADRLILTADSAFLKDWINDPENRRSIGNIVRFYTDCRPSLIVEAALPAGYEGDPTRLKEKLRRRYKRTDGGESDGQETTE